MYQKKKKWMMAGAVAILFLCCGIWYYFAFLSNDSRQGEQGMESIFAGEAGQPLSGQKDENGAADTSSAVLTPAAQPVLYVYLCGAVKAEGVYILPEGSRLFEAVEAAGGFTETAAADYHNLARLLTDGERIYIPTAEELEQLGASGLEDRLGGAGGAASASGGNTGTGAPDSVSGGGSQAGADGKININRASLEELMMISGIGRTRAEQIIAYRTKVGAFASTEEIKNVSGIGDGMYEKIKDSITVK